MRFDAFIGPSYTLDSVKAECQRTVNLYPELDETGQGKNKFTFAGTPGVKFFANMARAVVDGGAGPNANRIRGLWSGGGRLFVATGDAADLTVTGGRVFEVDVNGAVKPGTAVHTIANDADLSPVQMFANGIGLFVVSAGRAYNHNGAAVTPITFPAISGVVSIAGTTVTWHEGDKFEPGMETVTIGGVTYDVDSVALNGESLVIALAPGDVAYPPGVAYTATPPLKAVTGAFIDGFYVANRWIGYGSGVDANWNRFHISQLWENTAVWDPLEYAVKEGHPDNIVAVLVDHQYLWLFGSLTAEVWANTGNPDFPFTRVAPVIQQGCLSPWSPVSVGGTVGWIGMDARGGPCAFLAEGFEPRRVSTHAVEQAWRIAIPSGAVRRATSYAYTENGHTFWVVNFEGVANCAWVYDLTTNQWHERGVWDPLISPSGGFKPPLYRYHTFIPEWEDMALGLSGHIVGDPASGNLYRLSLDYLDDNGADIKRLRTAPHLTKENRHIFYHRLELDMEAGGIGGPVYTPAGPAGLSDAASGGTYSGAASVGFTVEIDATGTPDTFKWKKTGGAWTAGVAITGAAQNLSDGVTVKFSSTTGHTLGDAWVIAADPEGAVSLEISRNGGKTFGSAIAASAATVGDYGKRHVWRRLGKARDMVARVSVTGKSKVGIFNAYLQATEGDA